MGAPDDDDELEDLLLFTESFVEEAFAMLAFPAAASETCEDDDEGMKQLTRAEKTAIGINWLVTVI